MSNTYLIQSVDSRGKSTVDTENLVVDDCRQAQVVEDLRAVSPHIYRAILLQALVIESVHLSNLSRLMVSTNQGNAIGVSHFQCQKQQKGLNTIVSSINEVSKEEVIGIRALAAHLEEFNQIIELTMDVTADLYNIGNNKHHTLRHKALLHIP